MARRILSWLRSEWPVTRRAGQGGAWGCPSYSASSPCPAFILIYNSDHPLSGGVDMHMLYHDRLAISPPASIEGLQQVVLELDQFVGVSAVNRDVLLAQMALAEFHHAKRRET